MVIRMRRKNRSEWEVTAPTVETHRHEGRTFSVGQTVTVSGKDKGIRTSFTGTIERLVVPKAGWQFAVVRDGTDGCHACDFEELF